MPAPETTEYLAVVPSLYDIYIGNFTNTPVPRDAGDAPDNLHLVAGIFIYNLESRKFLVQQRSHTKHRFPYHFTDSASGHVMARKGMTLDTIKGEMSRELNEEMGVKISPDNIRLWTFFQDPSVNEIKFLFIGIVNDDALNLDPLEVTERSGWYSADELASLMETEEFVEPVVNLWKILIEKESVLDVMYNDLECWQSYWMLSTGLKDFHEWNQPMEGTPGDMVKTPLFLGRFQPFHDGHLSCLKCIRETSADVIIGLGSAQYCREKNNPLTCQERMEMISRILDDEGLGFDNVFIVPVPDIHNAALWMENVKMLFDNAITLYSNNDWVRGLATDASIDLGEKIEFDITNLNGTRVRSLIAADDEWHSIVPRSGVKFLEENGLVDVIKALQETGT
ncbi:MAG TPA: nicotinamide-nucleotide adenylyltransferase [Candidatus Lokiarchaeia archaeon]|nr:nicotinamide-nucleotide adenylyltransferase [Candidatus Lokiarchaeia archaeon]